MSNSSGKKNNILRKNRSIEPLDTRNPNFNKSVSPVKFSHTKIRTASAKPFGAIKTPAIKKSSGSRSVGISF